MQLGIATSGGGCSCAYSAGAVFALATEIGIINPKVVVGSSGSVGTLAYYVANQYNSIRRIWCDLLSTKRFISFFRPWRIMDIDYLIDEIFKLQEPLDVEAICQSEIDLFIAVTSSNKELKYLSGKDINVLNILRASKAMPLIYGKKITIGTDRYIDGAITGTLARNIRLAIDNGATHVLAIDTENRSPLFSTAFKLLYGNQSRGQLCLGSNIFILRPNVFNTSALDNKAEHLRKMFNDGFEDVCGSTTLINFLNFK